MSGLRQMRVGIVGAGVAVTSPGGTSAAAIYELEKGRLRTVLSDAVWAAYRRTQELGARLEAETGAAGEAGD